MNACNNWSKASCSQQHGNFAGWRHGATARCCSSLPMVIGRLVCVTSNAGCSVSCYAWKPSVASVVFSSRSSLPRRPGTGLGPPRYCRYAQRTTFRKLRAALRTQNSRRRLNGSPVMHGRPTRTDEYVKQRAGRERRNLPRLALACLQTHPTIEVSMPNHSSGNSRC